MHPGDERRPLGSSGWNGDGDGCKPREQRGLRGSGCSSGGETRWGPRGRETTRLSGNPRPKIARHRGRSAFPCQILPPSPAAACRGHGAGTGGIRAGGTQEGHIPAWQLVGIGDVWEHPAGAVQCFGTVSTSPSPPWWGRCWWALPPEAPQDWQLGVGEAEPAGLTAPGDEQMAGWRGRCVRGMDGRMDGWRD